VLEDSRYQKLSDKLSIHIFELPKVPKKIDPNDKKQLWMHLIKANSEEALEMLRATTSDPMIHKAIDAVYALNADAELREKIRQRDKAVRDYANDMAVAEDKGKAKKAVETAVNLIQNGKLLFEEIAGVTGLPLDDSCSMKSSSLQESSTCHCDRCFSHEQ
jgi:predicted transposase/invertase (TIGR01784 family)